MENEKRWYILGRIEVAYWIDRLYFARKRAGGIQRRKQKSTHMQKREERRDEGDLGVFFGEYEKDNWGERGGGFFLEESLKIDGDVLGREKREFWKNFGWFFEWDSEENCRHGDHVSGWNF